MYPIYDPEAVRPMWEELVRVGVTPLATIEAVDGAMARMGTTLLIINSVCGCAAGNARPGVVLALQNEVIPDHSFTVFAGVDREATQRAREYIEDVPPSSPSMALFKDGKAVFVLQRYQIEQMTAQDVSASLQHAFDQHCSRKGPSISPEEFEKINPVSQCGSSIPVFWNK